MKRIKHSKVKNTGLIFELLVRQVAVDTMNNRRSKSLTILNKHFKNSSELAKELKFYRALQEEKFGTEPRANKFVDAIISARKDLNESLLKREKYNLIKELKSNFNIDEFFKSRVSNYKLQATIYKILEHAQADDPAAYLHNKFALLEYIQEKNITAQKTRSLVSENKDVRILASKMVIDKFNQKYSNLSTNQKIMLREYINNVTNSEKLKKYILIETKKIQKELISLRTNVSSKVVRIKINEVTKMLSQLQKKHLLEDKDILTKIFKKKYNEHQ